MALFNPTPSPVVVDDEGHVLGGGESAEDLGLELDASSERVKALLETGRLIDTDAGEQPVKDASAPVPDKQPSRTARILPAPAAQETTTERER